MNRMSRTAPSGHSGVSVAAAVPSRVIGGITGATSRLARIETRLSWPEIAAISGAVAHCAASAMHSASAAGLGQPSCSHLARWQ